MSLVCYLCPLGKTDNIKFNLPDYLRHVQLFHAHQPHLQISCGIGGCKRTFRNYSTFRNHVSDWHSIDPNPTNVPCDSEFADDCHPGSSSGGGAESEESNSEDATDVESNGILGCLQQASAFFF